MEQTTSEDAGKAERADRLIRNHAIAVTAAVAIVPIPLVDLPVVSAVQLNLLRSLAKLYEKPFSEQLAKSLLAALMGGSAPVLAGSLLKMIVPPLGLVGSAAAAAASTYAVGKVFFQHFESGGTFLTFDPEKVREHYKRELANGPSPDGAPPQPAGGEDYGGVMP